MVLFHLPQDTVQLLITVLLLGDASVTLLTLLQFYWISLGAFLAILLVLPLSLLSPFPAGLNALFSRGLRRSSLARVYALWNVTSLSNIVSFCRGLHHFSLMWEILWTLMPLPTWRPIILSIKLWGRWHCHCWIVTVISGPFGVINLFRWPMNINIKIWIVVCLLQGS